MAGVYQPMAWLALEAQYVLFGLDPRGYHLTSLLLHAAVAVALLCPDRRPARPLPARPLPPASPGRAPSGPGWPRPCSPCTRCGSRRSPGPRASPICLCACSACWRSWPISAPSGRRPPRWGWLAGSLLLFAAALLSKAPAVALPAILVHPRRLPAPAIGGRPGGWFGPPRRGGSGWRRSRSSRIGLVFAGLAVAAQADAHAIAPLETDGVGASGRPGVLCGLVLHRQGGDPDGPRRVLPAARRVGSGLAADRWRASSPPWRCAPACSCCGGDGPGCWRPGWATWPSWRPAPASCRSALYSSPIGTATCP